jgi:hypothetical protein
MKKGKRERHTIKTIKVEIKKEMKPNRKVLKSAKSRRKEGARKRKRKRIRRNKNE